MEFKSTLSYKTKSLAASLTTSSSPNPQLRREKRHVLKLLANLPLNLAAQSLANEYDLNLNSCVFCFFLSQRKSGTLDCV